LIGETYRRFETLTLRQAASERLILPNRVYLAANGHEGPAAPAGTFAAQSLHALVRYSDESKEFLFLNARRSAQRLEYLCYNSGRNEEIPAWSNEHQQLLGRVLRLPTDPKRMDQWAARAEAEEAQRISTDLPEPATQTRTQAAIPSQAAEPLPDVPGFQLLSVLGRGGMGVVYRARQASLDREVALKCVLRPGDPESEARFAREIRALGKVEHPHLVKIFTSGTAGAQSFYAMELVEGATLAAVSAKLGSHGTVDFTHAKALADSYDSLIKVQREKKAPETEHTFQEYRSVLARVLRIELQPQKLFGDKRAGAEKLSRDVAASRVPYAADKVARCRKILTDTDEWYKTEPTWQRNIRVAESCIHLAVALANVPGDNNDKEVRDQLRRALDIYKNPPKQTQLVKEEEDLITSLEDVLKQAAAAILQSH
jgi:hypothetical protein